jgi:antitoxin MazE
MRTQLVKIGNSQGIRIPKPLIEEVGLGRDIEISIEKDSLVVRPAHKPREGWAEAFKAMAEAGEDQLLDPESPTEWDETEWEWE